MQENNSPKKPISSTKIFIIGIVIFAFLLFSVDNILYSSRETIKDESYYEGMAIYYLKERLKDPKSAEFINTETTITGDEKALVHLTIRAKNSFGAYNIEKFYVAFDGSRYNIVVDDE